MLAVVAVKVAINLAVSGRYGWHRDELYYADAGRHLDWGFVDFPPLTPVLAAVARALTGDSLVGLRGVASLAGAGIVIVVAALARDLGGGRRAQVLAAVAICPLLVGSNAMFQTVSFDQLTWALVIWSSVAVLRAGATTTEVGGHRLARAWLAVGSAVALAWATKYTVGVLIGCLALGTLATPGGRRTLRGWGPVAAGGLVAVAAAPNLWWQARHGWPSVEFFTGRNSEVRGENPPWRFGLELVLITGPVAAPLAVSGLRSLWRDPTLRALGLTLALVAPVWLVLGGKSYYAAPLVIGAFPAGAVAWERGLGAGSWRHLPLAIGATALVCLPLIAPALPTATMVDLHLDVAREDYGAQLGWPELAATVDEQWDALSPDERQRTVVVAANYGEAGALARFSSHPALPIVSSHLTHRLWPLPPGAASADSALVVGDDPAGLAGICAGPAEQVAALTNRWGVDNDESGRAIVHCALAAPLGALRARLAHDR